MATSVDTGPAPARATVRRSLRLGTLAAALWTLPLLAHASCGGMALHAHRGAPGQPENSLSSVKAAMAGSWDGAEIDLQQLRDGTLVLHHDQRLGRTTSLAGTSAGNVEPGRWREIRLKNTKGEVTSEMAPFLSDVLEGIKDSDKVLNAEIKELHANCNLARQAVTAMHAARPGGQWFLTSIDRKHLRCARSFDPTGYLGVIVLDPQSGALNKARFGQPMAVPQPNIDANWLDNLIKEVGMPVGVHLDVHTLASRPDILRLARERSMPVFTYSLRDDRHHTSQLRKVAEITQLMPSGAIIDGDPDSFCKALK